MGTGSVIRPGDVQRMSAGTGVRHSEFNASKKDPVHFLQIWIEPDRPGHTPSYEQKSFSDDDKRGRFRLIASRDGRDGSVTIHQDANLYARLFAPGETGVFEVAPGRHAWVHVAKGAVRLGGELLRAGDAVGLEQAGSVEIVGQDPAEVLVFDLA
jgi:redox-sensitive bicupin YhaK (pirin superfamily)